MVNRRSASLTPSSSGTFVTSLKWYVRIAFITELARNTMTADTSIGTSNDVSGTIATSTGKSVCPAARSYRDSGGTASSQRVITRCATSHERRRHRLLACGSLGRSFREKLPLQPEE